jgi:tetratricopeptide (TPR) repeat protein/tRNA A-37 threonylcarbamoyl transferase component Bud32
MALSFPCPRPSCGKVIAVSETVPGQPIRCPHCGEPLPVPAPPAATLSLPPTDSAAVTQLRSVFPPPPPVVPGDGPEFVGRFRIRRRLGEGAFGVVYQAHDPQLDREVALKVAKPGSLNSGVRIERFLREAKAAGQLRHPHIVPIFDAGLDGDRYYIASAFIQGRTLEAEAATGAVDVRWAAQVVRSLAEALAYAHALGIVHRDVKPANVMLEGTREVISPPRPLLLDFGLAARQDEAEKLTHEGAILGTPLYMAPEQGSGQHGEARPASDQYSLGVLLYELLTGQAPFIGTPEIVIFNHIHVEPKPLRQVKRTIPRDLETICLKALSKMPEDRYPDCQALADDLRRFLEGEPIRARRLSLLERGGRFCKREPRLAAALLAVVVILGTATALLAAANDRERDARSAADRNAREALDQRAAADKNAREALEKRAAAERSAREAREQRDRAGRRFRETRAVVDKLCTALSEQPEMKTAGMLKVRTALLTLAVDYYERFTKDAEGNEPDVQAECGRTYERLARLFQEIGRHDEAEQAWQEAVAAFERLADPTGANGYLVDLAVCRRSLGDLYRGTGRFEHAEKSYLAVVASLKRFAEPDRNDDRLPINLAMTHHSLGLLYWATGRKELAEREYGSALIIYRRIAVAHPESAEYQSYVASTSSNLGILFSSTGRNDRAEQVFQEALTSFQQLATDHPQEATYQRQLATGYHNLGALHQAMGNNEQAEKELLEAVARRRKLAAEHPELTETQSHLASSLHVLANLYRATRRADPAEKAYLEALAIRQRLATDYPELPECQRDLGVSLIDIGIHYRAQGRNDLADKSQQEALALFKRLTAAHPEVPEYAKYVTELQKLGKGKE